MKLRISNDKQLTAWMNERMRLEHDMVSVKGPAPEGATDDDGGLIVRPVNVAWKDTVSGEVFAIEYEAAPT